MRIGQGYDVHKLVEGRKLILGGVEITDAVRASAREMRQMAAGLKKYKKS